MAATPSMVGSADPQAAAVRNPYSPYPNWFYPAAVAVVLTLFSLYAAYVVLFFEEGRFGSYLSPFTSPEIHVTIGGFAIPTGIWIFWVPLSLRATCYYYRKAYFRSFLWHPRACAVGEPDRGTYRGETRFWAFNNLHRFAFYLTAAQVVVLWYDAVEAFFQRGSLHPGLGTAILLVNVVCLSAYTFGCHAFRHLAGGGLDCFSCHRLRHRLWQGVTVLGVRHATWAWTSMFTVWAADLYIRLLILGVIPAAPWV